MISDLAYCVFPFRWRIIGGTTPGAGRDLHMQDFEESALLALFLLEIWNKVGHLDTL